MLEQVLSREGYETEGMKRARQAAVERASRAKKFGLILGTLGRQGSPAVLAQIEGQLKAAGIPYVVVLLSEVWLTPHAHARPYSALPRPTRGHTSTRGRTSTRGHTST